jgi:hypothetical protein
MKKHYAALIGFLFAVSAHAQTITINSPTTGQQVQSGNNIIVNFSNPTRLNYGVSYLYKSATMIGSITSTDYPSTNYAISSVGLAVGTDYRVKVSDAGNPSNFAWSGYFSIVTIVAPTATPATNITEVQFTANWNAVPGATNYWLDISPVSDFSSYVSGFQNQSTASMTGTATAKAIYGDFYAGHTYYLRVRASNATGTSTNSNTIVVLMKPPAPGAPSATNITSTSFTANWNSSLSATEYRLDVSADNFSTFVPGYNNLQVLTTSKSITGLTAGGTYKFRVRSVNATATSNNSTSAPVDLFAVMSPVAGGFIRQCESYVLRYKGAINSPRAEVHLNDASGPLVQTLGVPPNTISADTYNVISASSLTVGNSYQIKVYEDGNPSNYVLSGIFTAGIIPAPASIYLLSLGTTSIEISWDNIIDATSYGVDVSTSSNFSSGMIWNNQIIYPYQASNVYITGLTTDVPVYVRVKSYGNCGTGNYTSVYSWTPTCPSISVPTANSATTVKATSFVANWTAVSGATNGYDVVVNWSGSPTTYTGTAPAGATSLAISPAHSSSSATYPATNYTYKVRAKSGCATTAYSNIVSFATLVLPAPTTDPGSSGEDEEFTASWYPVAEANRYDYQVSTRSDFTVLTYDSYTYETYFEFAYSFCTDTWYRVRSVTTSGDYSNWTVEYIQAGVCGGRMAQNIDDKTTQSPVSSEAQASPEIIQMIASPNPVENTLRVSVPSKMNKERLDFGFVDMTGRMLSPSIQLFQGYAEIDMKPVPSGVYILSLGDGVNIQRTKVVRK